MRRLRWGTVALAAMLAAGCATSRAIKDAESATIRGDHDSAVAFYRQALGRAPERVDLKIALERATRQAAAEHVRRARELEAQDQLAGAVAEYRLAADLDVTNTLALTKAIDLERRMRAAADAARPAPRIDQIRQQANLQSSIPRLDPRIPVPLIRMPNAALRDVLASFSRVTGINITYDQNLDQQLNRAYPLEIQGTTLEEAINQVLTANTLTFKVVNPTTIFVYADNQANRQKFEDQYTQTFYISHADPAELVQILNQLLATGSAIRPVIFQNKSTNSIVVRATAPVMGIIEKIIDSNDKAKPEVMVEAEILEVDRSFIRKLGLDLTNYAIGLTFSPEVAPPNTSGTFPGANPPPFNANTISQGVSAADFYLQSPTAVIQLLESNTNTKVLAKSQLRGRDGTAMSLRLGDLVPIPQTVFQSAAAGGVANIPSTQVQYQPVGINLLFTPRVTHDDEIVLDALTLQKSGLGNFLNIGGQSFPTIIERTAVSAVRLRDGEPNMLAGLLRDEDRKSLEGFPGINKIPILRSLFGNSDSQVDQTDIIMIIRPHIVRGHDLSPQDLRPLYIGTGSNIGAGTTPTLISPEAIGGTQGIGQGQTPPQVPLPGGQPPAPAVGAVGSTAPPPTGGQAPPPQTAPPPTTPPQTGGQTRAPGVVPIQALPPGGGAPEAPQAGGRVTITAPTGADGTIAAGSGPYTVPVQISGVQNVGTLSLSITYNPSVLRPVAVNGGTFMTQGGVTPTFVPNIDQTAGRIDIAVSRPAGQPGASGTGFVASISFQAVAAGSTTLSVSGVASATSGTVIPLQFTPANVVVK